MVQQVQGMVEDKVGEEQVEKELERKLEERKGIADGSSFQPQRLGR